MEPSVTAANNKRKASDADINNQTSSPTNNPSNHWSLVSRIFPSRLLERRQQLSKSINPSYINNGVLGFSRVNRINPIARFYTINITNFRSALTRIFTPYLKSKIFEAGAYEDDDEVTHTTSVVVNACMTALYAKLRKIHRHAQLDMERFKEPSSYTEEIELPVPFADAIQNLGMFTPQGTTNYFICVPVYPVNIQREGRDVDREKWFGGYEYTNSVMPYLKLLRIPVKSVDKRVRWGSPWWMYKVEYCCYGCFDLRCVFPASNYSDHSAVCASMFVSLDGNGVPAGIIEHGGDDDEQMNVDAICRRTQVRTDLSSPHQQDDGAQTPF